MTRPGRRYKLVLRALIAAPAVIWVVGAVHARGLPDDLTAPDPDYYVQVALGLAFVASLMAAPWVVAVWLLRRAWWARTGARQAPLDPPARLLAAAAVTLPADRRDWGAAMTAELAQVRGRAARWWFAAGCARAALFPPRASRAPVLMVARSRRLRPPASSAAIAAAGLAGVAACITVVGYFLVQYPGATAYLSPAAAVFLAAVLAGCVWLVLGPPRGLVTSRLARRVAVGAALALGVGLVVASRLDLRDGSGGIAGYLFFVPVALLFANSAAVAAVGRSVRAGVQAAVWTALLGSLAVFAVGLVEAVRWYRFNSSLIFMGDTVPLHAAGETLGDFIGLLVLLPFWWLPFGLIGAALGSARWWHRRGRERRDPDPQLQGHPNTR